MRALDPARVELGAHGLTHCRLAALAPQALRAETFEARARLEQATGRAIRLFAYPYGQLDDFDAAAQAAVEDAGFLAACSTHFGRGSRPDERFRLRRVGIVAAGHAGQHRAQARRRVRLERAQGETWRVAAGTPPGGKSMRVGESIRALRDQRRRAPKQRDSA